MTTTLLQLTVTGGITALWIMLSNLACRRSMSTPWRRVWWLVIPLAFLLPVHARVIPAGTPATLLSVFHGEADLFIPAGTPNEENDEPEATRPAPATSIDPWIVVWMTGAGIYLLLITVQTVRASRLWSKERLSTDSELLVLLEDCKAEAGVSAPIGLVLSRKLRSPALLGWLRPRILIPAHLAETLPREQLRAILLHELAHFRNLDIPVGWLFTLVNAIHWFNPLAHLATLGWKRFREEAADETAVRWMSEPDSRTYEEALLSVLKTTHTRRTPFGALAIGESFNRIKHRFTMIQNQSHRALHTAVGIAIASLLLAATVLRPVHAEETPSSGATTEDAAKKEALKAMTAWLALIDKGDYATSWKEASKEFRSSITEEQWTTACKSVRVPLGKLIQRELASMLHQNEIPSPGGKTLKGDWMIAQFDSSYENAKYIVETVTFQKEKDGAWRAAGYYIKPKI